jgi:hypothetical protein
MGLIVPPGFMLASGSTGLPLALAAAAMGEILDRAHFYGSLEVTTPRNRMASDVAARRLD